MLLLPVTLGLAVALAPVGADLEWSAPADCPPGASVEAAAAALLGRPIDAGSGERIRARGTIAREAHGFRLDLEVRSGGRVDRRSLRDPRCQVLAEAAALILATTVDPTLAPIGGPPPLPPEPVPFIKKIDEEDVEDLSESSGLAGPAVVAPAAPDGLALVAPDALVKDPLAELEPVPPAMPAPAAPERLRAVIRVSGVFDQGSVPGPTGGLGLAVGVLRRGWRVELGLGYLAPREIRPDAPRPLGSRLSLWTASIRGCGVAGLARRVELAGCGAVEAGAMLGTGLGVMDARTRAQPWLAVVVGPELAWRARPRFAVTLGVDAVLPLVRPVFTVDGYGPVFRGSPAGFRGLFGFQLRLP